MTKFKVTLNFRVNLHYSPHEDEFETQREKWGKRREAFERTDKYYEEHNIVEYLKTYDAMEMVQYIPGDAEVLSAEWDPSTFAIHMVVETDQTAEELREDFQMNSLEDGEYEACEETGWILFTRGPNGEIYHGVDGEDVFEYGLVDFRENSIVIKPKLD